MIEVRARIEEDGRWEVDVPAFTIRGRGRDALDRTVDLLLRLLHLFYRPTQGS